jgi:hypothetical protein
MSDDLAYLKKRATFCDNCEAYIPSENVSGMELVRMAADTESVGERDRSIMEILCIQKDGKTPTPFAVLLDMHLDLLREMRAHVDASEKISTAEAPDLPFVYLHQNLDQLINDAADFISDWLSLDINCTIGRYRDGADDEFDLDEEEEL